MIKLFTVACGLFCVSAALLFPRTFTSKQGDQIQGDFVSMAASAVTIKGDNGQSYTIPFDSFSAKDQEYIQYQAFKNQGSGPALLSLKMRESKGKTSQESEQGLMITTWEAGYRITLENETALPMENLIVQYGVFKFAAEAAGDKRTSGELQAGWGIEKVSYIAPHKTFEFDTRKLPMRALKLKGNYVWEGGGKRRNSDDLKGLWVRVYWNDILVLEYKSSDAVLKDEVWSKELNAPKAAPIQ